MVELLEALVAVSECGTVGGAATRLRRTPSAISRRLSSLEAILGRRLLQPRGRGVELTPEGRDLVARTGSLLAALREAVRPVSAAPGGGRLVIGMAESLLASFGARWLRDASRRVAGMELEIHAHRSPRVVERVRSGELELGIHAGDPPGSDLWDEPILEEPMVVVLDGLLPLRSAPEALPVLTIEAHSATWRAIQGAAGLRGLSVTGRHESFTAVVQLARAGFGHGLAPLGVATSLGIPAKALAVPPGGGLTRPIRVAARRSALSRPLVGAFVAALRATATGIRFPEVPRLPGRKPGVVPARARRHR